ncbi:hypothetical protein XbrCFBP1976_07980 [Xanthomonas bromi]|uniref:Uncharacterized protein n=1 Tax=Xanthomonas bromi TaxID=56449 RepID=A0ABX5BUA9_9XANT|nr:hypothetical protein XbrCFBP1976_07980 [Xanthomonas bromi]
MGGGMQIVHVEVGHRIGARSHQHVRRRSCDRSADVARRSPCTCIVGCLLPVAQAAHCTCQPAWV